eukprot:scaffold272056_cov12-Tisochrysis_lutea.AAC.1
MKSRGASRPSRPARRGSPSAAGVGAAAPPPPLLLSWSSPRAARLHARRAGTAPPYGADHFPNVSSHIEQV